MYIADVLKHHVQANGQREVSYFDGRSTTYADLMKQAEHFAGFLQESGFQKGDILALLLPNTDRFLVSYFACQLAGFTVLPINIKLAPREIDYILNHSEAKGLLYANEFTTLIHSLKDNAPFIQTYITIDPEESFPSLESIIQRNYPFQHPDLKEDEDTAVIFYTSGTTGRPKGVMLTNKNIISVAKMWAESLDFTESDRMQIVAPLFHCAASHVFSIPIIYAGGTLIIESGFSPKQALETMEREDISVFFGVPAMYNLLLNEEIIRSIHTPSLRLLTYGAAPMPYELIKKVKELFPHVKVQNLYGQTENSPAATTLKDPFALDKIGSVGEPLPNCLVRVVDEQGNDVPTGIVGEIIVKGPHIMKGYLKNPEATAQTIREGWLYSGDLGRFDEDHLLYIVDRKKDMIIRGGENVYPVEIEEVLYENPRILEAAVVGVEHEILGEVPKAFVVIKKEMALTEEELLHFCSQRLARYKVPEYVDFVDVLPRNASGKVLKTQLREDLKYS